MKRYENDYTDYFVRPTLTQQQVDAGLQYGEESGVFQSFDEMLKVTNRRGLEGWQIVSAWERDGFVGFCLSIVWQRELDE